MLHKLQFILLGFLLLAGQLFAQNRQTIDSLKTAISKAEADTNKILLLNNIASIYDDFDLDTAIIHLNKALNIAREIKNNKYKAILFTNLGKNYCYKTEYLKSLEYLDLAENIASEYFDKHILADINYTKTIVFININNLYRANEHAQKALQLYEELNDLEFIGLAYSLISMIYNDLGDYEKAIYYDKKIYSNLIDRKDTLNLAATINNLSRSFNEIGLRDSAYSYMRRAINLNIKNNKKEWLAINYHNLAKYKFTNLEYDSASYFINKASELYKEIGYLMNIVWVTELEAKIALAKKDTSDAIILYNSILNSQNDFGDLKVKVEAFKALFEIKKSQDQLGEAIHYYQKYNLFDDSLKKESNTSLLTHMEMQLEYEQKQNKLELENKEVKLKSQRKNFMLIIMTCLILLLVVSVYYIFRMLRAKAQTIRLEKKRVEEELEFKNREMTANVMALMKKNEILKGISKKMLEVEKTAVKDETKKAIKTLSKEIQKSRDVELWEEFDIRFKQVNSEFYSNLLNQFPDLSPNEQKFCAFLRMNMSTKDISDITGFEPQSIDNARSRIRKKLNIDSRINLVAFLSKF